MFVYKFSQLRVFVEFDLTDDIAGDRRPASPGEHQPLGAIEATTGRLASKAKAAARTSLVRLL